MPTPRPFGLPMKVIFNHTFARVVDSPKKLARVMGWNLGFGLWSVFPLLMGYWFPPRMPAWVFCGIIGVFAVGLFLVPRLASLDLDGKKVFFPWLMGLVLLQGVVNFLTPLPPPVNPAEAFLGLFGLRMVPAMLQGMGLAKLIMGWKDLLEATRQEFESFPIDKQRGIFEKHEVRHAKVRLEAVLPKVAPPVSPLRRQRL